MRFESLDSNKFSRESELENGRSVDEEIGNASSHSANSNESEINQGSKSPSDFSKSANDLHDASDTFEDNIPIAKLSAKGKEKVNV